MNDLVHISYVCKYMYLLDKFFLVKLLGLTVYAP